MTILFVILIIIASFVLGLIVLIQNPKGGGLAGSFAGISTQFMGVKQTNDVLERGTWVFAGIIAVLCLTSTFFLRGSSADQIRTSTGDATNTSQSTPLPGAAGTPSNAVPFDSGK